MVLAIRLDFRCRLDKGVIRGFLNKMHPTWWIPNWIPPDLVSASDLTKLNLFQGENLSKPEIESNAGPAAMLTSDRPRAGENARSLLAKISPY